MSIAGATSCTACLVGSASEREESAKCTICVAGKYASGNATECRECGAGKFSQIGADSCSDCEAGRFQDSTGRTSCEACSSGKFSDKKNAEICSECPPGRAQYATGQSECADCRAGTIARNFSAGICDDCPGDRHSFAGTTECSLCVKGFYVSLDGDCVGCPEGTDCSIDGGSTQVALTLLEGYWRIDDESTDIVSCPMAGGCEGGTLGEQILANRKLSITGMNFTKNTYCAHGYTGPLVSRSFIVDAMTST